MNAAQQVIIIVRDPDAENNTRAFGCDPLVVDLDLGYMDLRDPIEWREWMESRRGWRADITNPEAVAYFDSVLGEVAENHGHDKAETMRYLCGEIESLAPLTRAQRLAQYTPNYVDVNGTDPDAMLAELVAGEGPAQYLLIEENVRGGYWLTTHASPADATDYDENQEYADDWSVELLVDLDTGQEFMPGDRKVSYEWTVKA